MSIEIYNGREVVGSSRAIPLLVVEIDEFAEWYAAYPRKRDRKAAEAAYRRACRVVSHETLMAGVRQYRVQLDIERTELKFVKYPASWLNGMCWEDYLDGGDMPALDPQQQAAVREGLLREHDRTRRLHRVEANVMRLEQAGISLDGIFKPEPVPPEPVRKEPRRTETVTEHRSRVRLSHSNDESDAEWAAHYGVDLAEVKERRERVTSGGQIVLFYDWVIEIEEAHKGGAR